MNKMEMITSAYQMIKEIREDKPAIGYKSYYGKTLQELCNTWVDIAEHAVDAIALIGVDVTDEAIGLPVTAYMYKDDTRDFALSYNDMLNQLRYYAKYGKFRRIEHYMPELKAIKAGAK